MDETVLLTPIQKQVFKRMFPFRFLKSTACDVLPPNRWLAVEFMFSRSPVVFQLISSSPKLLRDPTFKRLRVIDQLINFSPKLLRDPTFERLRVIVQLISFFSKITKLSNV